MPRYSFTDKVAVITGAASGIGEGLAKALAAKGCHLALTDRDAEGLERLRSSLASNQIRISIHPGDVTDPTFPDDLKDAVKAHHGKVDVIINNAGIAHAGHFADLEEARFNRVMDVNFEAPVRICRSFLKEFRAQGSGYIANVSSVFGLIAPPGQSAYSSSKFALRGFTEALAHELIEEPITVSAILPGGVDTNIVSNVLQDEAINPTADQKEAMDNFGKFLTYPPEKAARDILVKMEKQKRRITFGPGSGFIGFLVRAFPTSYIKILGLLGRRA